MKKLMAFVVFMSFMAGSAMTPVMAANGVPPATSMGTYTNDNVGAFTETGYCNPFGVCGTPQISISGSSSGTSVIQAPATGGGTLTLPVGAGTLALATGAAPVVCGATCTVAPNGAAHQSILLNLAAGSVATLPAASGSGNEYTFFVIATVSSNKDAILAASSSDAIVGTAMGENSGTAKFFVGNSGTFHSIQMPFAGTQPSGGFNGDTYTCTDLLANVWNCTGNYQAGTTPTIPYSAATS